MFNDIKKFFPIPQEMRDMMIAKIKSHSYPKRILGPEGGKGDLLKAMKDHWKYKHDGHEEYFAMTLNPDGC